MSAHKTRLWSACYSRSDIARVEAIEAELAARSKPKIWLYEIGTVRLKTMYAVLAGTYPASPTKIIEKLEAALGMARPEEACIRVEDIQPVSTRGAPEPEDDPALHEQILSALVPYSKQRPIAREDLIASIKGRRKDISAALDALIVVRRVCDVIITRRHSRPVVYCYPAGNVISTYSFRVAKPKAKIERRV